MDNYVCHTTSSLDSPIFCCHTLTSTISFPTVSSKTSLPPTTVPFSYQQAVQHKEWQVAMTFEFKALYINKTWDIVPLSKGKCPISCKWVYKLKHKSDGSIERYKARLVVRGFTQKVDIDYNETFSPVINMTTLRSLVCIVVKKGWTLHQHDVNNTFLHGDLHEEVYMKIHLGLDVDGKNLVCKLRKSLYGLKQASRQWYAKLSHSL